MISTKNFFDGAKGLARNPLGIIALFISLIYGIVALLLGVTVTGLQPQERRPLIWFIVLFPIIVLLAFFRLVTKHHGKLYAPKDYSNDESFLKTLPLDEQEARINEEIASTELLPTPIEPTPVPVVGNSNASLPSVSGTAQGHVSLPPGYMTLRDYYLLAENLVIQKLAKETGLSFRNQVSFGHGKAIAFDAVAQDNESYTAVEVKLIRKSMITSAIYREALYKAVVASDLVTRRSESHSFKFILAIVVDGPDQDQISRIIKQVNQLISEAPIRVELRIYKFDELKSEFTTAATV